MIQRIMIIVTVGLLAVGMVFAQENKPEMKKAPEAAKPVSHLVLQGYVVDAMCAKNMAGKETTMKKAAAHSKDCALEKDCSAEGYGLFSDGKWYKFDAAGDKQAKALIEKSSREKGLAFEVTGKVAGDLLAVAALKEIKALKAEQKVEKKTEVKGESKN